MYVRSRCNVNQQQWEEKDTTKCSPRNCSHNRSSQKESLRIDDGNSEQRQTSGGNSVSCFSRVPAWSQLSLSKFSPQASRICHAIYWTPFEPPRHVKHYGVPSGIPAKNQSRSQHSTWECNIWLDKDQHSTLQFNFVVLNAIVKTLDFNFIIADEHCSPGMRSSATDELWIILLIVE